MSSLLEQAFVDAKALKEAALKNAEASIVDKYSSEVKETLNKILEQDEFGLAPPAAGMDPMAAAPAPACDAAEGVPLGAPEGEELCACPDEGEKTKIKINFDELAETLQRLEEELDEDTLEEDEEIELTEDDDVKGEEGESPVEAVSDQDEAAMKGMEEDIDMDSLVDAIMEKFSLDEDDKDSESIEEVWGDFRNDQMMKHSAPYDKKPRREPVRVQKEPRGYYNAGVDRKKCEADPSLPECWYEKPSKVVSKEKEMADSYPKPVAPGQQGYGESLDADALVDAVMERLTVDMGADLTGWAGRRTEDKKFAMEKELASRRSTGLEQETHLGRGMADRTDTDPQTELEDLKQAQEELVFENSQLNAKLQNYENVVGQLKESVTDVNLSNARLLYTNRVLRNTSLNERQKQKIAEAISKAGSVPEAKTIFETLQSTVESTPKRGPQSLSETINRRSSILRASNHSEAKKADPIADRLKKLAGIN